MKAKQSDRHWFRFTEKQLALFLGVSAFLLYLNTLSHGFVLDDVAVIVRNRFVQKGIAGVKELFTTFYWQGFWDQNTGLYRPLSMMMFAIEWQFLPNTPFVHHLINVVLYALCIPLVYSWLRKLMPERSNQLVFFVVLLFAFHPLHTEVVANIKSRDEILGLLFFMITGFLLIDEKLKGIKFFALAFICNVAALLSKESAITAIPAYALMLYLFRKSTGKGILARVSPVIVSGIIWLGWRYYVTHYISPPIMPYTYRDNSMIACSDVISRYATGIVVFGMYILKSLWPATLSYDYSFNQIPCRDLLSPEVWGTLAIGFVSLFYAWKMRATKPHISFGILFFFISLSVSGNVLFPIGTIFGERLLCTPLLGFELVFVSLLFEWVGPDKSKMFLPAILVLLALAFGYKSFQRNKDWKNDATLFAADVNASPNSSRVNYNYGTSLLNHIPQNEPARSAHLKKMVSYFEKSISIDTGEYGAYVNAAVGYHKLGQYSRSIERSLQALQKNPKDSAVMANLADSYVMNKQYDEAIKYYTLIENSTVVGKQTFNMFGTALFSVGNLQKAIAVFSKGVEKFPDYAELWLNYGNALGAAENYQEAISAFENAYKLDPTNRQALFYIAMSYKKSGDDRKSAIYFQRYNDMKQ